MTVNHGALKTSPTDQQNQYYGKKPAVSYCFFFHQEAISKVRYSLNYFHQNKILYKTL